MNDVVIHAEGLGKQYNLGVRKKTFRESMVDLAAAPMQRARKLLARQSDARADDSTMWALKDATFEIRQGEVVGLLGPNGAGKTTSFYMIVGLVRPDMGRILVDSTEITRQPMYLRARSHGISYLPQEPSVFRKLTVEENIMAILEAQPLSWENRRSRMETLIEQLGLGHIRKTRGYALSGGERRRVEIARCLATEPDYILLDEPFAGIDPLAIDDIREIIVYLRNQGIGILITDHNVRETLGITDRAYIMTEGRILRAGVPAELVDDKDVRRFYLGERFEL